MTLDDIDLVRWSRRELGQRLGFLFQNPDDQLLAPSVAQDVAHGPLNLGLRAPQVQERGREALEQVGMAAEARNPWGS